MQGIEPANAAQREKAAAAIGCEILEKGVGQHETRQHEEEIDQREGIREEGRRGQMQVIAKMQQGDGESAKAAQAVERTKSHGVFPFPIARLHIRHAQAKLTPSGLSESSSEPFSSAGGSASLLP